MNFSEACLTGMSPIRFLESVCGIPAFFIFLYDTLFQKIRQEKKKADPAGSAFFVEKIRVVGPVIF